MCSKDDMSYDQLAGLLPAWVVDGDYERYKSRLPSGPTLGEVYYAATKNKGVGPARRLVVAIEAEALLAVLECWADDRERLMNAELALSLFIISFDLCKYIISFLKFQPLDRYFSFFLVILSLHHLYWLVFQCQL